MSFVGLFSKGAQGHGGRSHHGGPVASTMAMVAPLLNRGNFANMALLEFLSNGHHGRPAVTDFSIVHPKGALD